MIDPDARLQRLREIVKEAAGCWGADGLLLDELSTLVAELDQALSAGGPLPRAWRHPTEAEPLRVTP